MVVNAPNAPAPKPSLNGQTDVQDDPLDLPQIAHLVAFIGPTGRISLQVFVGGQCVGVVPIGETHRAVAGAGARRERGRAP